MLCKPGNFRAIILKVIILSFFVLSNVWAESSEHEIFKKAKIYYDKKKYKEAVSGFTRVIQITPDNFVAYYCRGNAYHRAGKPDLAISDYLKAMQLAPDYAGSYMGRGAVYLQRNKNEEALADFNRAIELNPEFPEAYYDRALVYFVKKEYDKSWADAHKAALLGWKVRPQFLESLRKASGRDK